MSTGIKAETKRAKSVSELLAAISFLHAKGWAPATSSNYSFRLPGENQFTISRSGVDKGHFSAAHLMVVDQNGIAIDPPDARPSAETGLHCLLYLDPRNEAVLHTHSVNGTVLSLAHEKEGGLWLSGFEILKGLKGITTHETKVWLPIFRNSQDIEALSAEISIWYEQEPLSHGFLIAGHGLYAWGSSISEAKRHIEVYEFIFDCMIKLKTYGHT